MMHDGLQEFTMLPGGQSGVKEYFEFIVSFVVLITFRIHLLNFLMVLKYSYNSGQKQMSVSPFTFRYFAYDSTRCDGIYTTPIPPWAMLASGEQKSKDQVTIQHCSGGSVWKRKFVDLKCVPWNEKRA